ncbi:hypothetical protein MTYP_01561 [Methylophilaceae bacterium]|nr:hypothetical protein MTYP_01561 [Methylophilaceae bacterium]
MHDSGWNLGAYGYFDRRRSEEGNYFNQGTLGAEVLGRDWDFRTNVYHPIGDRAKDLGTRSGGAATATLAGTAIQVVTPGSTMWEERALKGYDAEVGWRVPFFDAADHSQLRLYLGRYRFADGGMTVSGPRLRAELALAEMPGLWQGSQFFLGGETQHDDARGTQSFLSLRLRIPFGGKPEGSRQLTMQKRRMTAPVMRDVDIVTQSRVVAATPTLVETATGTVGGQTIAVLDSGTVNGQAAIQAALDAAGANSTVVLSGNFTTAGTVNVNVGQTLMGAGSVTVRSPSGRTVTLTTPGATIESNIAANGVSAISMADNSTLSGMTIVRDTPPANGDPHAVEAIGVNGATIVNNTLTATSTNSNAFGVYIQDSSNITISGNTISGVRPSAVGIGLYINNSSVKVADNTLGGTGSTSYAVYLVANGGDTVTIQPGSTGNTFSNGVCGFVGAGTFNGTLIADGSPCP